MADTYLFHGLVPGLAAAIDRQRVLEDAAVGEARAHRSRTRHQVRLATAEKHLADILPATHGRIDQLDLYICALCSLALTPPRTPFPAHFERDFGSGLVVIRNHSRSECATPHKRVQHGEQPAPARASGRCRTGQMIDAAAVAGALATRRAVRPDRLLRGLPPVGRRLCLFRHAMAPRLGTCGVPGRSQLAACRLGLDSTRRAAASGRFVAGAPAISMAATHDVLACNRRCHLGEGRRCGPTPCRLRHPPSSATCGSLWPTALARVRNGSKSG